MDEKKGEEDLSDAPFDVLWRTCYRLVAISTNANLNSALLNPYAYILNAYNTPALGTLDFGNHDVKKLRKLILQGICGRCPQRHAGAGADVVEFRAPGGNDHRQDVYLMVSPKAHVSWKGVLSEEQLGVLEFASYMTKIATILRARDLYPEKRIRHPWLIRNADDIPLRRTAPHIPKLDAFHDIDLLAFLVYTRAIKPTSAAVKGLEPYIDKSTSCPRQFDLPDPHINDIQVVYTRTGCWHHKLTFMSPSEIVVEPWVIGKEWLDVHAHPRSRSRPWYSGAIRVSGIVGLADRVRYAGNRLVGKYIDSRPPKRRVDGSDTEVDPDE